MSGATLPPLALSNAQTGAQSIVDVYAQSFSGYISFVVLLSVIGAGIWIVKRLYTKFTRSHRM